MKNWWDALELFSYTHFSYVQFTKYATRHTRNTTTERPTNLAHHRLLRFAVQQSFPSYPSPTGFPIIITVLSNCRSFDSIRSNHSITHYQPMHYSRPWLHVVPSSYVSLTGRSKPPPPSIVSISSSFSSCQTKIPTCCGSPLPLQIGSRQFIIHLANICS